MDEIQKLYNLLVDNGYYTKSFDEFKVKFKDPAYQDKVYGVLTRDGLYKKDTSEFKKKYAVAEQVVTEPEVAKQPDKKKVVTEPPIATALPSGDGSLVSPKPETEQDYFTGAFGKVLKGFDEIVPLGIGDFVDDMARSVAQGYRQGTVAQEADKLLLKGTKATPEQIQKFIDAQKNAQQLGESAEMKDYQKIYEGEGKGFWGVVKGLANNPSVIPQVMYSSLSAMATNTDALKAGATAVGTGTAIGAGTGAAAGGVGAIPGAVAGATASVPYAFGLASSVVEAGSTFGELLTEELGGKEMTKENVKNILEDPNKLQSIRNKAIARGLIIGTVDALTGKLASGVGAKVIGKSAAKSATGAVTKGAVVRATAAGAGVEAVGGSAGEAAARAAIGQDMDVSEIALEGLAELPGGVRSTIQARFSKPTYKVNGEKVTAQEVDDIIETMTPEQLAKTDIKIENDYEGRNYKIQDKIVTGQLRKDIRDANPDANEKTIDELVRLEKELKKFEGNNTQSGKDKAAAIRSQIRNVQENGVTEEAIPEEIARLNNDEEYTVTVKTLDEVPEQFRDRVVKKEGVEVEVREKILGLPIGKKTSVTVGDGYTYSITGKEAKDYAIQKQTTGEVPVQPGAGISETLEEGEPQAEPQVTTTEGVQEGTEKEVKTIAQKLSELPLEYGFSKIGDMFISGNESAIAQMYVEAKANNTNPEIVEKVESIIGTPQQEISETIIEQEVSETELTEEEQKIGTQLNDLVSDFTTAYSQPSAAQTTSEKRTASAKATKAVKKLNDFFGFTFGSRANEEQASKQDALSYIKSLLDPNSPSVKFANITELMNAYKSDKQNNVESPLVESVDAIFGITPTVSSKTPAVEDVIDLDVSTEDNLQKVLNVLDKIDNDISQRLRSGANEALLAIPLSTVQVVVKAVKALVKGGMALRDAIKKVSVDNNLTEKQVSDVFNKTIKEPLYSDLSVEGTGIKLSGNEEIKKGDNTPTVTTIDGYQDDYSEDDILNTEHAPNSRVITHASDIASGQISYTKKRKKITFKLPYVNKAAVKKINSLREKYKAVKGTGKEAKAQKDKLKKEINKVAKQVLKDFTDVMTQNLLALYDTLTPEFIANSKNWYVGANRMANAIAQKYNMTIDQVGGIIAVLSPQNDWFNNVSVAERVINIMTKYGDTKLTKDIVDKAVQYNSRKGQPNDFANDLLELFNQYGEVSINELDKLGVSPLTQSAILRAFDQALNSPKVAMTDPQGLFVGFDKTPVRWNSEAEISKAIGIFRNGDINNINENLGDGNKVRNFYNNIVDPNSKTPYVTADTHALSAALNGPISANDAGGFGLFNGSLEPAYALVKSAYIKAAQIAGIKPREMQSITWEAQRIGINDKKRTEKNKQETFDYLEESRTNEKTSYERATELIARNRSGDPEWGKSRGIKTQKTSDEIRKGAEVRSQQRVSTISNLRGRTEGGLGETDTEVGEGVTGREAVNEILDLDVTDKDNLQTVLDFLDNIDNKIKGRLFSGANESLFALPLSTIQVIVKAVKVLVKGGMALRDAIKKVAADNNVTESDVINSIQTAAKILEQQGKPEGVSEMELPGYNRMINELEGVIEKSRERGLDEAKSMENAIAYLQGSKVYEDASDTQREKMVRDVRKMFGKRERPAPKPDKLFGEAKDVKMITMSEYDLNIKQIKDLARGAKDAKALWSKISAELVKYLKSMVLGGYITTKQVTAILRKFSSVNMFNDKSIEKFVEYMAKVFKNADYAEQISKINAMLPTARKNAMTKLGIAEGLTPLLQRLFSINPTLIPDSVFDKYTQIVTMIGEKKTVLQLNEISEVTNTVNDILSAVDEEVSLSEELAERFDSYQDKVVDENGKINFAETVKQMLKDNVITEEEADIMRKYKNTILPREGKEARSEDEINQENEALVNMMRTMDVDYEQLPTKDERNLARELKRLIKTDGILGLDNTQLKNLFRLIDNINNGYLPHYAQLMVERMNAVNNSKQLDEAVMNAKPYKFSVIYAKLKSLITKKDKFSELIRRNPLYYIDQVFGDFKTKNIFNSLFEKAADAQAQFQKSITELNNRLQKAEDALAKSFKYNANKILESKFKMMTYMIQLEYESNPNNKQVNPAGEYLTKTIKHILNGKSSFGERDANILQSIYDEYADANGNIDINKLYDSFNEAEKNAIKIVQKINEELRDKAVYTAAIIRGDRINPLNNYVHLNVLHEHRPDEAVSGVAFVDDYNNSMRPSTKAKSLIERTGKVAPLNFDIFASANRGAKFVLMDYYLTEPIRTARKTINETSKLMEEQGADRKQRDIFNAIDRAFEETVENLLTTNFTSTSFGDDVVNFISKQGYRAVLASVPRFIGELSSNIFFALIASPKDFMSGVSNKGVVLSPNSATIMSNVGSKQTNRLFPHDTLSGRLIDTSIMNEASGVRGGRAQSDVANKIQQIYNISIKKYQNTIETMADALISTPDKMVMRPMWFGAFSNAFKKQTGEDVDFDKIADNDERYMARYKEAIEKARMVADDKTVLTGATDNAFMGMLKGTPKQNQSAMLRGFNIFNNYMTRFLIYEYATARTGIMAAMGNGSISRKQGVALLGAVTTRMTTYTLITSILSAAMVDMFTGGDDEEDEKSFLQKVGQGIASSVTSLLLGRDFGNATKSLVNYGIERFNENYLDFLREGEYDPYKDALQYSVIPPERKGKKTDAGDLILNMMGPFGPAAKTADLIVRKATEPDKKQEEAIQRSESETNIRIPLEVLGNLGMIPLYKDVRKVVNAELYKELNTTEQKAPMNKIGKEDMQRYFPDMYEDLYGKGGALYDIEEMKKEIRKDKEELSRKIKDEMYEYTPKPKGNKKK